MALASSKMTRRHWLQLAAGVCAQSVTKCAAAEWDAGTANSHEALPPLGKVAWVNKGQTVDEVVEGVQTLGLTACQIGFDEPSLQIATALRAAAVRYGVQVTAISEHNPGERIFDFYRGPLTIGIIPSATRSARIAALKKAADVAHAADVPAIHTHCGFIPEDPNDALYPQAVAAVREIAGYCKEVGLRFLCETGQETPITLVRLIEDVGLDNVFVNLDVANLILYGKGNPVDAMDVLGERVRGLHAKDGLFPTSTRHLGQETPIGQGRVDFARLFQRLKQVNYRGPILIEREVGNDEERRRDTLRSKVFLQQLLTATYGA